MKNMDLTSFYYKNILGFSPDNKLAVMATECTISYLIDCGLSESEIVRLMSQIEPKDGFTPDMLPGTLWDNSLLNKGELYLHKELRLPPPPMKIDVRTGKEERGDFSNEMKIFYSAEDLLSYFYKTLNVLPEFRNKKHIRQIEEILDRYKNLRDVNPVELVLELIDNAKFSHYNIMDPKYLIENGQIVNDIYMRVKNGKMNEDGTSKKPIWRGVLKMI